VLKDRFGVVSTPEEAIMLLKKIDASLVELTIKFSDSISDDSATA